MTELCKKGYRGQHRHTKTETKVETTAWREFVAKLKQCGKKGDLREGKLIHANIREAGCHSNRYVANTLISMYSKCGSMQDSRHVFERMVQRDVVSWNSLIIGYVENGECQAALDVFVSMGCAPDSFTYVAALKACAGLKCLEKGMVIHKQARECGFEKDVFVASTLVYVYSKCCSMQDARDVFERSVQHEVVSWTALILGYVENGQCLVALDVFAGMHSAPNSLTYVAALKACAGLATGKEFDKKVCLEKGMVIHRLAREKLFDRPVFVGNTLIDMYSKCGSMPDARDVFERMIQHDVVSWTALMLGYVENGECLAALDVFNSMDCAPDGFAFAAVLKACATQKACLENAMALHRQAIEYGFYKDLFVATTLVDMYSKCGSMRDAHNVFEKMALHDAVSWNSLILGYVENGECLLGLEMFASMDCAPDTMSFVAAMKGCASLGALKLGVRIHNRICELGLEQTETVANCVVDFYGKCGDMCAAEEVFDRMHLRSIVSWNALIGGYCSVGCMSEVFRMVKRMQEARIQMDDVSMLLVLTACNHASMVEEGLNYFNSMSKYGLSPSVEHYTCMVDMLGRANRLQEALSLVETMPFQGNSRVWTALLGACEKWSNVDIGRVAFHVVVTRSKYREDVAAAYVLMGHIYKSLGMRQEQEQIEDEKQAMRARDGV